MLRDGAAVAMALSGGKDSSIAALATNAHLDRVGHTGPRALIHSDLGRVEWRASMAMCEKVAERLNLPLYIVRRTAGDMMDRWLTRWTNSVRRYRELECVKLILPWSTPSMRFCTSELKTKIICAELVRRFPGQTIINVTGIRRAESTNRAKAAVFKRNPELGKDGRRDGTIGYDWHSIIDMETEDVFLAHKHFDFPLHEAYSTYGSTRVSCAFCIMGNEADLRASAACSDNQEIYREMCALEIASAFSFQSSKWLSDVAPHLLTDEQRESLQRAKAIVIGRTELEARIPNHLLYTKGWPTCVPTQAEAELLCAVRCGVSALQQLADMKYLEPDSLRGRYEELMALKETKVKGKAIVPQLN